MQDQQNGGPQIVIIGAGPSGLATGYFLKKRGYKNVLILEKLGRVGGLCDTITSDGHSFDLGANYVTPAYTEVLKIATEVGAKVYTEQPFVAMKVPLDGGRVEFSSMFKATRYDDATGKEISPLAFIGMLAKYTWLRWRLSGIIDKPTMAGIENYPDLCAPFSNWLAQHGLQGLTRVFELPITMMGYGRLDETPALYGLKFMSVRTFVPMAGKEAPFIGRFLGWPKRFTDGFQRLWEKVSWGLEVRCSVEVTEIVRESGKPIVVRFVQHGQELNRLAGDHAEIECDYLILACPQTALLGRDSIRCDGDRSARYDPTNVFMQLFPEERELFQRICEVWYCMITFHVKNLQFGGNSPLAAVYPLAPLLHPRGIAKQWNDSEFTQFYSPISPYDVKRALAEAKTRMDRHEPGAKEQFEELSAVWHAMANPVDGEDPVRKVVIENVYKTVKQMGGTVVDDHHAWHTYNRFTYFQHVDQASLVDGFYTKLETLQGRHNTFFVGGATNFELVEPIVEYAKNLVETHFAPVGSGTRV